MKKILGLTVALIAVIAMLGTGTWAYFNDVVAVEDNTITAGDLYLNNITATPVTLGGGGFKPNTAVATASIITGAVKNAGTINGILNITLEGLVNNENSYLNIETKSGDSTSGLATGELGSKVKVAFWFDVDMNGSWSDGAATDPDFYIDPTTGAAVLWLANAATPPAGAFGTVDSFDAAWAPITMNTLVSFGNMKMSYEFPNSTVKAGPLSSVTKVGGGTGYTLGDVLTFVQGGTQGTITVTGVTGGVIDTVSLTTAGEGYTNGQALTVTGPGADDATFTAVVSPARYYTDNVAQNDSLIFDLVLELTQAP